MFCSQCGANNQDTSKHCSQCGTALNQQSVAYVQSSGPVPPPPPPVAPQPSYGAAPPVAYPAKVPNYMVQAVLVTLFCCLPLGIWGIVRAASVNTKLAANDYAGALEASKNTKTILWVGFGVGLGISVIYLFAAIANVASHNY